MQNLVEYVVQKLNILKHSGKKLNVSQPFEKMIEFLQFLVWVCIVLKTLDQIEKAPEFLL